ncbi:MAG: hypothetical protein A3B86_03965 [Candidatus Yanofskybacteria bacterium RIFCSPHIGHO2_02_FULL_38_22b]|uniref:Uncharacterized protein n=1 Tax=Candidatus Yanofskybacteria bacterium RIFCSPHIGHO2_02_FULL_38_22b TaxID=1802673 RepID=A0A1F8EZF0_9BACT|nr:MAG: hypothetical protein A2816_01735 [Candidatus Yanofskybacteria bacterium RIFCSPHIGHO2_01_FULL_39_44]OGN06247.1 MAG: hypothetical protein A3B86_03965 [Candidatus Yanofskybacteria bacterium RIFCSPHIGHO2_02_FULL_38_22b]OGN19667.1 MAG: hypothetical protein A2910_03700 [Candidatus Yanofskybacteria bacterium RIFCSPLOWO2_01_FULL_39_28]
MRKKPLLDIILSVGLLTFAVLYVWNNISEDTDKVSGTADDLSKKEILEEYKDQIKEQGPEYAYQAFKDKNQQSHFLAHLFGEALFYVAGTDGVGVCDDTFEFGCYHGFFSAGIQEEGMGIISKFDEACLRIWGSKSMPCQHGIGHGLMSSGVSLEEALGWCRKITWQPTGGCTSGVFMEYNFPALSDHTGTAPRKEDDKGYFYPCIEVLAEFKNGCYIELPQWWLSVFSGDFIKIGSLCNEIKDSEHRQYCFYGLGNYAAPSTGYDISRIIKICGSLPSRDSKKWCRESAAWIFLTRPDSHANIAKLCEGSQECLDKLKQNPFYEN